MEKFKQFFNKYLKNNICLCIILAFVLNFAIEAMARQSLLGGADYLMQTPVVFFYNTLILLLLYSSRITQDSWKLNKYVIEM